MQHAHHSAFESLWVSAPLILVALVYARGWLRVRKLDLHTIETWRAGSFRTGAVRSSGLRWLHPSLHSTTNC